MPRRRFSLLVLVLASCAIAPARLAELQQQAAPRAAADCERLARMALPATAISAAQFVAAGTFSGPPAAFSGLSLAEFYKSLPAFCRVAAMARPTSDSTISIEVWMPVSGWNGKLRGVGNGGFAGAIDYQHLGRALRAGYAAVGTDAGHAGSPVDATWALGHPEKVIDFGHRAVHEMTVVAKESVRAFYGAGPQHSYFTGCSDGGREALMEAQRYPADYDGILAGAPANYWTHLLGAAVWNSRALMLDEASDIRPAKLPALAAAVVAACDADDNLRDGILNDPSRCAFDPARLLCKDGNSSENCLTAPQIAALKAIYDGPRDSSGRRVFPGYSPGAEEGPGGWGLWITGPAPGKSLMFQFGQQYFSNMVYEDPRWDYRTFKLEEALALAERKTAAALNATDADLSAFMRRGGKLILYHGWGDAAIPPLNTIDYYRSVVSKLGQPSADSFVRLFMVPGMQHCADGPGADSFGQEGWPGDPEHNVNAALEQWVERGTAPPTIIAGKPTARGPGQPPKFTRPLCPYPQVARYKGTGDPNLSASFVCMR